MRGGAPQRVSTPFLAFLAAPFAAAALGVWALRPQLLELRGAPLSLLALALLAAPVTVALEFLVHAAATYRATGRRPRGATLERFWSGGLSVWDSLLLAAVAAGEELVFRQLWISVLAGSFALPGGIALAASSLFYGLNHLAFGPLTVASKTLAGLVFGSLFLAGGSLWPPLVAHTLANLLIFKVVGRDDG